jgi:acetylornithine deacetylase/succinyl-diaminopimelate desuccinylase-like protein
MPTSGASAFSATRHAGRIWGRGAGDMKSTVRRGHDADPARQARRLRLRGDLIFAAGADEESGGEYGFAWLAKHHPEELRADVGLHVGGGALVQAADGRLAYLVCTGEKGRLEVFITVKGRGWHANQPWRADNAIYKAQEVIRRIIAYQPEIHVDPVLIDPLADLYGIGEPVTAATVDRIAADLEARGQVSWGSTPVR